MESGLQSWVQDHSNITMFNFIAYPIFSKTPWYWLQTPQKPNKGKNSLPLSPSHLKEHNCLSLIQLHKKERIKKTKKSSRNFVVLKWTGGEKNSAFLRRSWSGIVKSENTKLPPPLPLPHTVNVSCVLIMHRSEWRLLHDSDLTLNSFLTMFIFCFSVFIIFFWRGRSVNCQLMFKMRIKALFYFLVFTHFRQCF